jgi:hypothetical protein
MVDAPCTELLAQLISSGEAKIGDGNAKAIVEAENILRLQVTVINTETMTILNCIEQLKEYVLNQSVVPEIAAAMQYLREQVVVRCVVHDNIGAVVVLNDTMQSNDARVR